MMGTARRKLNLEELLEAVTPQNRHPLVDWGPPVGREFTGDAWEECRPVPLSPDGDQPPASTPR